MSMLDIFAVIVLICLALSAIVVIALIGWLPGSIARKRQHPHAQAVSLAGWLGLIFIPLWPLALIWAHVDVPQIANSASNPERAAHAPEPAE